MKAIFLDKDGTLVENVPYNVDPALIQLMPGAADGLAAFHAAGYKLIVVSNQSGVARGRFPESALQPVETRLRELLSQEAGVPLAGFYYCPHHPDGTVEAYACKCSCRKPLPGLLLKAAADHGLDLRQCWMIGDILDDVQAGRAAGCCTVLVDNGGETEWVLTPERQPHLVVRDLSQAACLAGAKAGRRANAMLPVTWGRG